MRLRYIANACFEIRFAGGEVLLTDPWFDGPCQQTWWNFPPVPDDLKAEVWSRRPTWIYVSHLHHDHLHPQTLAPFDRDIPIVIGAMNTPNLRNGLKALGFQTFIEIPFETPTPLGGATVVMFKDFHGNTRGDETQVVYDLDTSLYLTDADGARLFLGVDNTLLPADAARIAATYGAPDVAQLPYASASLFPMAMADYDDDAKHAATAALRKRTRANFVGNFEAIGARRVVPAGGEYVLGGPAAGLSRFLPQPLERELAEDLAAAGHEGALAKLYPGDDLDTASLAVTRDARASHRDFTDEDRAAYALTLSGRTPTHAAIALPADLPFDWPRALHKCAANLAARRAGMSLSLPADVDLVIRRPAGALRCRIAMDGDGVAFPAVGAAPEPGRLGVTFTMDETLMFALVTGLLSWNAMEASALIDVRRTPDVYTHDIHRAIVHFTLLS